MLQVERTTVVARPFYNISLRACLARAAPMAVWQTETSCGCNTGWRRDPGGDNSRRIDRQELPPAAFAGGDTGSATVFFFGGTTPPRFRWVASRRGYASCMRHYGAGPCSGPDRM